MRICDDCGDNHRKTTEVNTNVHVVDEQVGRLEVQVSMDLCDSCLDTYLHDMATTINKHRVNAIDLGQARPCKPAGGTREEAS